MTARSPRPVEPSDTPGDPTGGFGCEHKALVTLARLLGRLAAQEWLRAQSHHTDDPAGRGPPAATPQS